MGEESHPSITISISNSNSPDLLKPTTNNPSKIPIRPQKIRKLSTTTTTPSSSSPKPRRRSSTTPTPLPPLSSPSAISSAVLHLRNADPLLSPLLSLYPPPSFESQLPPFLALSKSILFQQLAFKAASAIFSRFLSLCGGQASLSPRAVLSLTPPQLKQIGVSARKTTYLFDLANKYESGILSDEKVVKMDDRSLFTMLSMVKGIGSWSVHMFMIFSLHRPDVLPVSDLGVRKGVQLLYGLEELPKPSQMECLCEKWRPFRSVGAWYMWRFAEGKGAGANALEASSVQPLQQIEPEQHQLPFVEPINSISNLG